MRIDKHWLGAAAALGLLNVLPGAPAGAQTGTTPPDSVSIADYSFGYELSVPGRSWTYDRTRFSGPAGSGAVGVLRGRSTVERGTLQVLFYRMEPGQSFDTWLESLLRQIEQEAKYAKEDLKLPPTIRISHEPRMFGERRAAVVSAFDAPSGTGFQSYYYCVAFDEQRVWVLILGGLVPSERDTAAVKGEFDRSAGSLRILFTPQRQQELAAGLARGQELLGRLRASAASVECDDQTLYYEVLRGGAPGGYFTRRIGREVRSLDDPGSGGNVKEGIRVRERSWLFARDGTARYTRVDLFASSDLRSELIETRESEITARPPAPGQPPARLAFATTDAAIREESKIVSTFTSSRDDHLPDAREQTVGPNYLGLAFVRLLPALLGRDAGDLHAFAIYDATTRALVTYTVKPLGRRPLPGAANVDAYAYEVSEAFAPRPALTFADERGVVLRVDAGDIVFQTADEAALNRKYAALRDAARAAMTADSGG